MWSLLAAAALAAPSDARGIAHDADFRCLAVVALALEGAPKQTVQDFKAVAGLTAAFMYYLGRLDVRFPDLDLVAGFKALDEEPSFSAEFAREATRCSGEAQARGQWLQDMGRALQKLPPRRPGKIG